MTRLGRSAGIAIALLVAACSESGGPPTTPVAIVAISANPVQSATVASAIADAPRFEVRNSRGDALGGVLVSVAVSSGGGTLSGVPMETLDGPTPIGLWTLGTVSGEQRVTVTVADLAPLVFTVDAAPSAAAALQIIEGNDQAGLPLSVLPGPVRVKVHDAFGNGVPGIVVSWAVDAGGGQLAAPTSTSDALGLATAPNWTIGGIGSGDQRVAASIPLATVFFTARPTAFNVEVRYVGTPPSASIQQAFTAARQRIHSVIVGDIPDVLIQRSAEQLCLPAGSMPAVNETIDDVVIFARVIEIDGPGQVLGSAGPCLIRNSNSLTVTGVMQFDSADLDAMVASGRLPAVILHEMLHVIGIGTLWGEKGLLASEGLPDSRFTGPLARDACVTLNGGAVPCDLAVPAENCLDLPAGQNCGGGTQDSHWKESIFRTEVMTGFAGSGFSAFSAISVQSLADLGYEVDLSEADDYTVPPSTSLRALLSMDLPLMLPTPRRARFRVDDFGRVSPIPERR